MATVESTRVLKGRAQVPEDETAKNTLGHPLDCGAPGQNPKVCLRRCFPRGKSRGQPRQLLPSSLGALDATSTAPSPLHQTETRQHYCRKDVASDDHLSCSCCSWAGADFLLIQAPREPNQKMFEAVLCNSFRPQEGLAKKYLMRCLTHLPSASQADWPRKVLKV